MFGVLIEKGPCDWQVFQQENGQAEVEVCGRYIIPPGVEMTKPVVYVRVMQEDSGREVLAWQPAEILENQRWQLTLTIPAGGLYRLESCLADSTDEVLEWATRGDMRYHLGVGDLYVIAGQSNSAGYGKDSFYDPPELGVHLCRNSMRWDLAVHPMNDSTDIAHPANLEGANPGASPWLSFAKTIHRETGLPVGLIQTSLGGSPLSRWNPRQEGDLYQSMLETVRNLGGKIRGVLWYQGCSDTDEEESKTYEERFSQMVTAFRQDMAEEVSWLTVQLNRQLKLPEQIPADDGWGRVREAQRQAARKLSNVWVIPARDCGLCDSIHNTAAANVMLGERAARTALRVLYQKPGWELAPDLASARRNEDVVELTFSHVTTRLLPFDSPETICRGFTLWDEHRKEIPILRAEIAVNHVRLFLQEAVEEKIFVSAGWQMDPPAALPADASTRQPILSFYNIEVLNDEIIGGKR